MYCFHWNVFRPGTNNDINVLMRSRLIKDVVSRRSSSRLPRSNCVVPDEVERTLTYLLGGGIHPDWPIYIKPIKNETNVNEKRFRSNQEVGWKEVERVFGVINGRFQIFQREIGSLEFEDVVMVANTCVILHYIIVPMQQNGDFRDEADGVNLITQCM